MKIVDISVYCLVLKQTSNDYDALDQLKQAFAVAPVM